MPLPQMRYHDPDAMYAFSGNEFYTEFIESEETIR